jgi:hypothetical protein
VTNRIIIATILITSLNFVSVFQSGLATVYTHPIYYKAIDTLQELDQSGLKIIIKYPAMMQDLFPNDSSETYKSLNTKMKLMTFDHDINTTQITYDMNAVSVTRKLNFQLSRENLNNHLVTECPKIYNLGYATARKSVYLERINEILLDIHCFGLFQKWLDEFVFRISLENAKATRDWRKKPSKTLTLLDLQLSFYILIGGLVISNLVLFVEIFCTKFRGNFR